jgi:hypothetical protein
VGPGINLCYLGKKCQHLCVADMVLEDELLSANKPKLFLKNQTKTVVDAFETKQW